MISDAWAADRAGTATEGQQAIVQAVRDGDHAGGKPHSLLTLPLISSNMVGDVRF